MALVKLRFKESLPLMEERILIKELGFHVVLRNKVEHYIEFAKALKPANIRYKGPDGLSDAERNMLLQRCNKVIDFYKNPELHCRSIRVRLHNIAQTYTGPAAEFINKWTEENVVEDQ